MANGGDGRKMLGIFAGGLTIPSVIGILVFIANPPFEKNGAAAKVKEKVEVRIAQHEKMPAHVEAGRTMATVRANQEHFKSEIVELKKDVEKLDAKMDKNKEEILKAIRESR